MQSPGAVGLYKSLLIVQKLQAHKEEKKKEKRKEKRPYCVLMLSNRNRDTDSLFNPSYSQESHHNSD
jgi:hypothetical protein